MIKISISPTHVCFLFLILTLVFDSRCPRRRMRWWSRSLTGCWRPPPSSATSWTLISSTTSLYLWARPWRWSFSECEACRGLSEVTFSSILFTLCYRDLSTAQFYTPYFKSTVFCSSHFTSSFLYLTLLSSILYTFPVCSSSL